MQNRTLTDVQCFHAGLHGLVDLVHTGAESGEIVHEEAAVGVHGPQHGDEGSQYPQRLRDHLHNSLSISIISVQKKNKSREGENTARNINCTKSHMFALYHERRG